MNFFVLVLAVVSQFFSTNVALAAEGPLERGLSAIRNMGGCYLVDYTYAETESLKPGYVRDHRVYDPNRNKSVKEWIYPIDLGPGKIRLQHILFLTDLSGNLVDGSELRHQAEDWEFDAPFLYEFVGPSHWEVKEMAKGPNPITGHWTRRITNLDDGLRYQCAAPWNPTKAYAEWSCDNYAPIPGRETRDMGRKDYQALQRSTRLVVYGSSWLERQENIKMVHTSGQKNPLAKEVGKNWYVRLPDSECLPAQKFMESRQAFWEILRETWDSVLDGKSAFMEKNLPGPPRFAKMLVLEAKFRDLSSPRSREEARQAILQLIGEYRVF